MNYREFLARVDALLERQRREPQYHERVASVRAMLGERHVAPEIIDRVIRLNPRLEEGAMLRGVHYTTHRDNGPCLTMDLMRKGEFLRRFGARAWAELPRSAIHKRGRREYVTHLELMQRGL